MATISPEILPKFERAKKNFMVSISSQVDNLFEGLLDDLKVQQKIDPNYLTKHCSSLLAKKQAISQQKKVIPARSDNLQKFDKDAFAIENQTADDDVITTKLSKTYQTEKSTIKASVPATSKKENRYNFHFKNESFYDLSMHKIEKIECVPEFDTSNLIIDEDLAMTELSSSSTLYTNNGFLKNNELGIYNEVKANAYLEDELLNEKSGKEQFDIKEKSKKGKDDLTKATNSKRFCDNTYEEINEHKQQDLEETLKGSTFGSPSRKQFENGKSTRKHYKKRVIRSRHEDYQCKFEGCKKTFRHSAELNIHMRIHQDVRPYICKWPNCNYKARQLGGIITHLRLRHFHLPKSQKKQHDLGIVDERNPREWFEIRRELL